MKIQDVKETLKDLLCYHTGELKEPPAPWKIKRALLVAIELTENFQKQETESHGGG